MLKYIFFGSIAIYLIIYIIFLIKTGKFLKSLILNVFIGIISLVILCVVSHFGYIDINLNRATLAASSVLGVPGVATVLILNMIF